MTAQEVSVFNRKRGKLFRDDLPVKIMRFYDDEVHVREVIAWLPKKMIMSDGSASKCPGSSWLLYDKEAVCSHKVMAKKVEALQKQIDKLKNDFEKTVGDYLDQESFREAQLALMEKAKQCPPKS